MVALEEAGLPADHPALVKARTGCSRNRCLGGDGKSRTKGRGTRRWAFEFSNDFYPDVDDTAFVLMALPAREVSDPQRMEGADPPWSSVASEHAESRRRLAAFDRDNDQKSLCNIPFADHNAMIDPSTAMLPLAWSSARQVCWPAEHPAIQPRP